MCAAVYRWRHLVKATEVTAGLAESNGSLLPGLWRDSLHVTSGLTACTPGSAPGPTLGNEYVKTLPLPLCIVCSSGDERFISFEEAASVLRDELSYPEDRAMHYVQMFDRNADGRLSLAEFSQFRKKIEES